MPHSPTHPLTHPLTHSEEKPDISENAEESQEKKEDLSTDKQPVGTFDILDLVRARNADDAEQNFLLLEKEKALKEGAIVAKYQAKRPAKASQDHANGRPTKVPSEEQMDRRRAHVPSRRVDQAPQAPGEGQPLEEFDVMKVVELRARLANQENEEISQQLAELANKPGVPCVGMKGRRPGAYSGAQGASLQPVENARFSLLGVQGTATNTASNGDEVTENATTNTNEASDVRQTPNPDLVVAKPIMEEATHHEEVLIEAAAVDPQEQEATALRRQKERQWLMGGCAVVAITLLVMSIVLGIKLGPSSETNPAAYPTVMPSSAPSTAPSSAPTGFLYPLLQDLPISTLQNIYNLSTPQGQAHEWLMVHPELQGMEEWRMKQRFALATFYYAFEGPHWPEDIRGDWMALDRSEFFWFSSGFGWFSLNGVYAEGDFFGIDPCNSDGVFQSLVLDFLELEEHKPFIPPEIALLTNLQVISLKSNGVNASFTDLIPSKLYQMTNMTVLNLFDNHIHGPIPNELGQMTTLQQFAMDHNSMTGTIPTEIGLMHSLVVLMLSENQFSGSIPSELGGMTNLVSILLFNNELTGTVPSELDALAVNGSLDVFWVGDNRLSGTVSKSLCQVCIGAASQVCNGTASIVFDCNIQLCGCDLCACPLLEATTANSTI